MKSDDVDYVVVGFSLAGIAAALVLADSNDRVLLLDYDEDTDALDDLPRVCDTLLLPCSSGREFANTMSVALERAGVERITSTHIRAISSSAKAVIECDDRRYAAHGVVFAPNGTEPGVEVEGLPALYGFGVSHSAAADAPFFRSRPVAVYGDSPRVIEHATIASNYAAHVLVLAKDNGNTVDDDAIRYLDSMTTVTFEFSTRLCSLHSGSDGSLVSVEYEGPAGRRRVNVSALFIAQHLLPRTHVVQDATGAIIFAGLAAGVPYWNHADLATSGVTSARALMARLRGGV